MPEVMPFFLPTQLAIILGADANDIREWAEQGLLQSEKRDGRMRITPENVALFLFHHPEEAGRVYCDDLIPIFNESRAQIVTILEQLREDDRLCQVIPSNKFPR